jgi:carbamate kinase
VAGDDGGTPLPEPTMLVVAALGQSALASNDAAALEPRIRAIVAGLAPVARSHTLVVTHSAGPRLACADAALAPDLQAAQAAGLVGHLLARELRNALPRTQVLSVLAQAAVHCDAKGEGAATAESPPCRIVDLAALRGLADRDDRVLCVGCVPVQLDRESRLGHSDARLDHDQVAAGLAIELRADILLLLTDVPAVQSPWPGPGMRVVHFPARAPVPDAFEPRTIGGKLAAACRFARTPGTFAAIVAADQAETLVAGRAGTCVSLEPPA